MDEPGPKPLVQMGNLTRRPFGRILVRPLVDLDREFGPTYSSVLFVFFFGGGRSNSWPKLDTPVLHALVSREISQTRAWIHDFLPGAQSYIKQKGPIGSFFISPLEGFLSSDGRRWGRSPRCTGRCTAGRCSWGRWRARGHTSTQTSRILFMGIWGLKRSSWDDHWGNHGKDDFH